MFPAAGSNNEPARGADAPDPIAENGEDERHGIVRASSNSSLNATHVDLSRSERKTQVEYIKSFLKSPALTDSIPKYPTSNAPEVEELRSFIGSIGQATRNPPTTASVSPPSTLPIDHASTIASNNLVAEEWDQNQHHPSQPPLTTENNTYKELRDYISNLTVIEEAGLQQEEEEQGDSEVQPLTRRELNSLRGLLEAKEQNALLVGSPEEIRQVRTRALPNSIKSSLPEDTFSFLIVCRMRSVPFFIGISVLALKTLIFTLIMSNLIDADNEENPLSIPPSVKQEVIISQFAALFIAVVTQDGK